MVKHYDIVIIGGGLIARSFIKACQGLSLAVVEAQAPNLNTKRTFAINPATQQFFATLGCWPTQTTPIQKIHVSQQGHFAHSRFKASELGVEALGYCVAEKDLLQSLMTDEVVTGATWYCPMQCEHLEFNEQVFITLANGETLSADLIVAADGAHSFVRRQLNIDCQEEDYQQTAIISNLQTQRAHQFTAYERFTPQGPLALLPLAENWVNCVYTVNTDQAEATTALSDEAFIALLQAQFGYRLGKIIHATKRVSFPLKLTASRTVVADRCVLIGNAAQTLHPVAGQGFNLGIRDVAILVEVLAQALAQQQAINTREVLEHYQTWRTQHQQNIIRLTDTLAKWFTPQTLLLPLLRGLSLQAIEMITPLKNNFCRLTMGYSGKVPSLMCGMPIEGQ